MAKGGCEQASWNRADCGGDTGHHAYYCKQSTERKHASQTAIECATWEEAGETVTGKRKMKMIGSEQVEAW